jgi:two-component system, NarL family, response regulator YdfI
VGKEPSMVRIVIVDDHLVVREGLRTMLEIAGEEEGFALVGEAVDGEAALHIIEEMRPDVVLMDLRMPGMDGLEVIERIHATLPQIAVVILTTYNEDELMLRGLRAGASGYLLKDINRETLFHAIRTAARGEFLLQPDIMARLLSLTPSSAELPAAMPTSSDPDTNLTEREREVLTYVAAGQRSKEIAARLGVSLRTVGAHLTSIYTKLGVDSRASAVAVGIARGLLRPSE